jgi:glutathione S-transferase
MKLYFAPGACSMSPHIVLHEAGLEFTTERVDLRQKLTASGADYYAINPKGYVPALELDDGSVLTEGPAIVQYLADQVPEKQLAPAAGSRARYQLMEWLNFISAEVHKSFGPLFDPAATDDMKRFAIGSLNKRLGYIAAWMAERDFVLGDTFSVADAYLFTVLNWTGPAKLDLSAWPVLQAYHARIGARASVQKVLRTEGLI